jgi:hypothetical protein
MKKFLLVMLAAGLAACGNSDNNLAGVAVSTQGSGVVGGGQVATDAFVSAVQGVIAATSDSAEPVAVDASAASTSDNREAVPI